MAKVAKIVWVTVGTRIIVDEGTSEDEIWRMAKECLSDNLLGGGLENVEILDDYEMPYSAEDEEFNPFGFNGNGIY